jgi:hypothetical protein
MTNLITREFNGKKIRQREDGYISATDICQASGKRMNNWLRLKSTEEYLEALSDDLGIPVVGTNTHCADSDITNYLIEINKSYLIEINVGGSLENNGSWVHRLVAIELAGWCSVRLRIQCNKWVEELLTKGYVIKSDVTSEQLEDLQAEIEQTKRRVSYLERSKEKITESVLGIYNIEQIMFRISKQLYPGKPNIFSKNGITYLGKKVIKELETEIGLKKTEMGWEHNIKNGENYVIAVVEAIALVFYNSGNDEQAERIIELFQIE